MKCKFSFVTFPHNPEHTINTFAHTAAYHKIRHLFTKPTEKNTIAQRLCSKKKSN